jgi:hypothetical protein
VFYAALFFGVGAVLKAGWPAWHLNGFQGAACA